jgi:hypothetical protein
MSIIKLKRSETAAASPTGLSYGEVAVNITDKKIFIGNSAGATVLIVDGNATGGGGTTSTETIQDAAASLFTTGTHTGISVSYPDTNNSINLVNTGVLSIGGSTGVISAATGRTSLGLVIGTNVQAYSATLSDVATGNYVTTVNGNTGNITLPGLGDFVFSARSITSSTAGDISIATLPDKQWTFSTSGSLTLPTGGYVVGLQIGIDVQRYDPTLAAIAGLMPDADDLIYFNGTDGASITTLTSFGRSLIDDVSATTARTTLGLTIGTNVQAWDADLDAIAALNGSTGVLKKTGSNAWSIDTDTYWKNTNDGASSGLDTDLIHGVSGKRFMENLQSGILYGGIITVNAGNPATVDITAGAGIIVTPGASLVAMPAPVVTNVTWTAQTAVALPQIANYDETWISFNSSGVVTLRNVAWTDAQYASEIPIGAVYHVNRSSVNLVKNYPHVAYGQAEQIDPFIRAFGPLKLSGHEISANGANLTVNRTSGKSYAIGRNYQTDPNNPNVVTDTNTLPASVVYRFYRNAGTGFNTVINTAIDPNNYDDGTGTLHATVKWTIQRIFFLPNQADTLGVYYGRVEYNTLEDAELGIIAESFTESESTATQGVFLGYLIVRGNTTDLSDITKAKFIQAGLFRNVSGGGGAGLAVTSIDDLTDVTIVSAAANDLLRWSGSQWVNSSIGSLGISTLTGIETLTNKTLTSPTISNLYLSDGLILVEGTTNDSNEMSLVVSSLTADRTITFPDATGSVITTGNLTSITSTGTIGTGVWQGTAIADSYISSAATWNTILTWSVITSSQTAVINKGYITNSGSLITVTLPTTAAVGSVVRVSGMGAGGWKIAQNASGVIHFGKTDTTTGTGGYISSTLTRDGVELVCCVANNEWNVVGSVGNITIV